MVTKGFYLPCLSHRLERGEWRAMKMRKVLHGAQASRPHILRLLTLCAFFAVGIVAGQLIGQMALRDSGSELTEYLQSYAGIAAEITAEPVSVLRVLAAYFRVPLLLLLLKAQASTHTSGKSSVSPPCRSCSVRPALRNFSRSILKSRKASQRSCRRATNVRQ